MKRTEAQRKYQREWKREYRKNHPETPEQRKSRLSSQATYHALHLSTHGAYSREKFQNDCKRRKHLCDICRVAGRLQVDHDHDHKCVHSKRYSCPACRRGLLCKACNSVLGWFHEDIKRFEAAIKYLKKYRSQS